jgi:hypothetical protein
MKPIKPLIIILTLFLFAAYSHGQNLGDLRISLIAGDVQILTEDTEEWVPASINMPLMEGDRIWVPEGGKTELQLRDGTSLRLDQKSALEILTLDQDSFQFYLDEGQAYANFRGRSGTLLQMDTPVSSTRAYEHSIFRIGISDEGSTQISVLRGAVEAESRSGKTTIKSGYTLTLKDETYAELSPLGPPDEWERWNMDRDRRLVARRPPSSYLPAELNAYSRDFETNGRWVYVQEYGHVWRPTVVVSGGWAPYRIGRWVWMRGDYVWVSYEPWGWVPYHYGRWAFVPAFGWCWVPPVRGGVFWGPGFVAWVRTPTYVAWVPLGPRETYYGHGHYGPHSVNITNVNITNIHVDKRTYKNINVRNAVTVVHHDTFVKGKRMDVKLKENPFLKDKILVGRPDIKHEKATVMPVIKEVPPSKKPPQPIRDIKVKEIKEKRPLVKEKQVSVFRPESPPKEMTLKVKEGKPVPREFEKARAPKPPQGRTEKPREGKPMEKRMEKPKSVEKGVERPPEAKPPEKGKEKPKDVKPADQKLEKAPKTKQGEKSMERPREMKPPEKGIEKPRESRPSERGVEPTKEPKPSERTIEKPRELKQEEKGIEKPREIKPPEKGAERPKESRPAEREMQKQRESQSQERGVEKPRETRPPEKGIEKPKESKAPERGMEKQKEIRPQERVIEKSRPQERGIERSRGPRSIEKRIQPPQRI